MSKETKEKEKFVTNPNQPSACGKCGVVSPGPKYELKTAVGYIDHTTNKIRNPAYTIPKAKLRNPPCFGPGPKYLYKLPGIPGYSFPRSVYRPRPPCTPGPKYKLPEFWSPAYTITGRSKPKCREAIAGPYDRPKHSTGPAYSFGLKGKDPRCTINPAIRDVGLTTIIKPRPPTFYIIPRRPIREICKSPGPKYELPSDKGPRYSFGIKHHICKIIPTTECDELC